MRVTDEELKNSISYWSEEDCDEGEETAMVLYDLRDARAALREIESLVCECDEYVSPCPSCIAHKALEESDETVIP